MAKTYTLATSDVADDQKTITISETKEVVNEEKITVAQLKEKHAGFLTQIDSIKKQADVVVDELQEINDNVTDITVEEIPVKISIAIK